MERRGVASPSGERSRFFDGRARGTGRIVRAVCVGALFLVAPGADCAGQDSQVGRGESTRIAGHFGVWAPGGGERWPRLALSVERERGALVGRVEASAISRPKVYCDEGIEYPECSDRKEIFGISAGARLMASDGRWRPFTGAGLGRTRYYNTGWMAYLEIGALYAHSSRWGGEVKLGAEVLGESNAAGAGMSVAVGLAYTLGG